MMFGFIMKIFDYGEVGINKISDTEQ